MLIAILEDKAFRKRMSCPYSKRWTVRVLAYNSEGKLAFLRIVGQDEFGRRNHLETIGGGVENDETLEETLMREVGEEIGYLCEIDSELGVIIDHYNLIHRETISNYFVVQLTDYVGVESKNAKEEELIKGIEFYDEEDALRLLSEHKKNDINDLVHRRDYIALKHHMNNKLKLNAIHKKI